jgi:hypothetical protein
MRLVKPSQLPIASGSRPSMAEWLDWIRSGLVAGVVLPNGKPLVDESRFIGTTDFTVHKDSMPDLLG